MKFADHRKRRAEIRSAEQNCIAMDFSRVVLARFFKGAEAAKSAARFVATGQVAMKPDKTGTQYVPDLVAIESHADKVVRDAEEVIGAFSQNVGELPSPAILPHAITRSTAIALYFAVYCRELVKHGQPQAAIRWLDDNETQVSEDVYHYLADLIDGYQMEKVLTSSEEFINE